MKPLQTADGGSSYNAAEERKKKRQQILDDKNLNIWQKKHLLDQMDEADAKAVPVINLRTPSASVGKPQAGGPNKLFGGLPGQEKKKEGPPKKATVTNPFTNLNKPASDAERLVRLALPVINDYKAPSIFKELTTEDYVRAWENRDWQTAGAYANGVRNGTIQDATLTPDQSIRMQNASLDHMPQWSKELLSGAAGVGNGATMDIMEASLRGNANRMGNTGIAADAMLNAVGRLKNEAPFGYSMGYMAGQSIPMYGAGGMAAGTVTKLTKNPYIQYAVTGAVENAAPTLVSGIVQGKSAGQIALETANSASTGVLYGMGLRYLGEVLPQPGTLQYYQLEGSGKMQKVLAPIVGRIAQVLSPDGAAAVDKMDIGNELQPKYNNYSSMDGIQPNDIMTYKYFSKKSTPGDDLVGHEVWQHSNVKSNGYVGDRRLSTDISKNNPVIVLDENLHKDINKAQKAIKAATQTPDANVNDNYKLLVDYGVSEDAASWASEWARHHLKNTRSQ